MHYELESSRMNYGSWPFLLFLSENPKFGPRFCYDIWMKNKRNSDGSSSETPFQTIMRLGVQGKQFSGNGLKGFGDVIGQMAARNVTWDYVNQFSMQKALANYYASLNRPTTDRTLLFPVPDKANTFRPIYSQAPRQYGVNIVDLVRKAGAHSVTVNFQGIGDETEGSDWRLTLVAVNDKGVARYSTMWRSGRMTMALRSNEQQVALAIAAMPSIYKLQGFRPGYNFKRRHLYEIALAGATPSAAPPHAPQKQSAATTSGAAHPNGGGFVEYSANVAPTAYVGPNAQVLGNAQVSGQARIEDEAIVRGGAQVSGAATVSDSAIVGDTAQVVENARVSGMSSVGESARVAGHARVVEYARVLGSGSVGGNALIKGFGEVYTSPGAPIGGGVIMGQDLEVRTDGFQHPINYGLIYGFNDANTLQTALQDNHYLYAHWDCNTARQRLLLDSFADNDATLRGKTLSQFSQGALQFDGQSQYALVEGSLADTTDITLDARLTWAGGAPEQRLWSLGQGSSEMYFTPQDASGQACFVIRSGGATQMLRAPNALPQN